MDISITDNQAAADSIILNAGAAGEKGFLFNQGEILKGIVEGIKSDGIISLFINGRLVDAASEVDVKPGQHLYLLVDSFKNSLTYLKVISEQGSSPLDDNNLAANLRSIGLPSNTDAILIANRLLQHNLPVNQQNVAFILNALNIIGGITARNIDLAVFILQHNMPLDKNILPLIDQFVSSDGDLSRLVRELVQILSRIETNMIRSDSTPAAPPSVVITSGQAGQAGQANAAAPNLNAAGAAVASTPGAASVLNAVSVSAENSGNPAASVNAANVPQQIAVQQNNAAPSLAAAATTAAAVSQTGSTAIINPGDAVPTNPAVPGATTAGGGEGSANNPLVAQNQAVATTAETVSASASASASATTAGETGSAAIAVPAAISGGAASAAAIAANPQPINGTVFLPQVKLDPVAPDPAAAKTETPLDLTEFVKILRAVLDSAVSKLTGSGRGVNAALQGMVRDRTLLLNNLRGLLEMVKADAALGKTPEGQELLSKISNLQRQITGQAVFNSTVKLGQDVFNNNYYFSFPVEIDNQPSYCQLRIQKKAGSRLDQQDNIKLVVSLDTPALGIVMFHIDWHRQGYIQLRGVMETSEAVGFIEKNIGELLHSLGELGYSVNNLGMKVAEGPKELTLKPQAKETEQDSISSFKIDVIA